MTAFGFHLQPISKLDEDVLALKIARILSIVPADQRRGILATAARLANDEAATQISSS